MGFVRAYARIAIALALLEIAYGAAGLRYPAGMDSVFVVLAILRTLWMLVSFVALLVFPFYSAPLWSPLYYVLFEIASLIFTLIIGGSFGRNDSPLFAELHHSREPIFAVNIGLAVIYAGLTLPLLYYKRPPIAQPGSEHPAPASVAAEVAPAASGNASIGRDSGPAVTATQDRITQELVAETTADAAARPSSCNTAVLEQTKVQEPVEQGKAEKPVDQVKAEELVEKAKAEEPVEQVKAEEPVEQVKAEKPEEQAMSEKEPAQEPPGKTSDTPPEERCPK